MIILLVSWIMFLFRIFGVEPNQQHQKKQHGLFFEQRYLLEKHELTCAGASSWALYQITYSYNKVL